MFVKHNIYNIKICVICVNKIKTKNEAEFRNPASSPYQLIQGIYEKFTLIVFVVIVQIIQLER